MTVSNIQSTYADLNTKKTVATSNETEASDRFLKLLVTQMQNQDPMNPMDNAQVTSQMAQISTVSGVDKLNSTVQGLSGQFMQMQALQSASLIGKDVIVPGNKMSVEDGTGQGGFELTSAADNVKVEVLNGAGRVVDTVNLGAQTAGTHSFDWNAGAVATSDNMTFRLTATSGASDLKPTALMRDKVVAVNTSGDSLTLELQKSGDTAYSSVKSYN